MDLFHIANPKTNEQFFFYSGGYSVWNKPLGVTMVGIMAMGGGGGGGAGHSAAAGNARGGGGGGGSAAITRVWIPAIALPDRLYILVGQGGAATIAGGTTSISIKENSTAAPNLVMFVRGGGGATNGTGAAVGGAGSAGGVTSANEIVISNWGTFTSVAGVIGAAGGAVAGGNGNSVIASTTIPISGGAGGAGTTAADFAGGNISAGGIVPAIIGGLAGSNAGSPGFYSIQQSMLFTGGSGGGASNASIGGAGGQGSFGSGGGGGGGGTTGGAGGRGGDGLALIISM